MRRVVSGVLAGLLTAAPAAGGDLTVPGSQSTSPHFMLFSGFEGWRNGMFSHGGVLWAPNGLDQDGFILKVFTGTGNYRYLAGGPGGVEVIGQQIMGSALPGWRFKWDRLEVSLYAGLDAQEHHLAPDDPASRTRGDHIGARFGADLWYEPADAVMLAGGVSLSTIGDGYWARGATGIRAFDLLWVGPEALALGDTSYWQARAGMHVTAFRTKMLEWSASGGWATDSDHREGWYGRLGLLIRR
jgi:hypothetical protein